VCRLSGRLHVSDLPGAKPVTALPLSEADFQQRVLDYAQRCHWRVAHVRAAQVRNGRWATPVTGDPGFPDLVLARAGVVLLAELKSADGKFRPGQAEWLDAADAHGRLWRPGDWKAIVDELR
jgi:hypothetical protein